MSSSIVHTITLLEVPGVIEGINGPDSTTSAVKKSSSKNHINVHSPHLAYPGFSSISLSSVKYMVQGVFELECLRRRLSHQSASRGFQLILVLACHMLAGDPGVTPS